jgi:hypothetical protein
MITLWLRTKRRAWRLALAFGLLVMLPGCEVYPVTYEECMELKAKLAPLGQWGDFNCSPRPPQDRSRSWDRSR